MKIYLASRYGRREELKQYSAQLEKFGHTVTARWLSGDRDTCDDSTPNSELWQKWAREDIEDIRTCDTFIVFTGAGSRLGGAHVETGIALALGKDVFIIGPRVNVFHHLADGEYLFWRNLIKQLLIDGGYDGLYVPGECACELSDLEPCDGMTSDCKPGYKRECDCGEGHNFHVGPEKPND
jgi:hypothetical protein